MGRAVSAHSRRFRKNKTTKAILRRACEGRSAVFEMAPLEQRVLLSSLPYYEYAFEGTAPFSDWTNAAKGSTAAISGYAYPSGGDPTLTLGAIVAHQSLTVSFTLYIFNEWEGHGFDLSYQESDDGTNYSSAVSRLNTTFSNLDDNQCFPASDGNYSPQAGAAETGEMDDFACDGQGVSDAKYTFTFPIPSAKPYIKLVCCPYRRMSSAAAIECWARSPNTTTMAD